MKLSPEQIKAARVRSAEDWATLIQVIARRWLASDHVAAGARGDSGTIVVEPDGDVAIVLAEFYQSLAAELPLARVAFRNGLRHAIRECVRLWLGYREIEALLGVVKKIDSSEFNQVLLLVAQSDGFRALESPQQANLFGLMLGILRQQSPTSPSSPLSENDVSVSKALTDLCKIDTFPLQLVYRAFEVLIRADPAHVIAHLELLEVPLLQLRVQGKEFPMEWFVSLRAFSAQFPSRGWIEGEGFGWANDWLFDDSVLADEKSTLPGRLKKRMGRGVAHFCAIASRHPSYARSLGATPPQSWTPLQKSPEKRVGK